MKFQRYRTIRPGFNYYLHVYKLNFQSDKIGALDLNNKYKSIIE